jgi:phosphatidylserine/phosphatidylglycerophosphate/cardiolipin synthase-like enzyme
MGKVARASRGKQCLGVLGSKTKCNRALDQSGLAIVLNRNCAHCGEQRCRKHCRCGRKKNTKAQGRSAPRARRGAVALPVATVASRAPAPAARVSESSCVDLDVDVWYRQLCADIKDHISSQFELATYMYDDEAVQRVLLKRLQGKPTFKLTVYIDAEMFAGDVPRFQKCRLKALHDAGAQIFICKGLGPLGAFHGKAVVIDANVLYTGSANLTRKSRSNEEFCYRMRGPVAQRMLVRLEAVRRRGKVWDGS